MADPYDVGDSVQLTGTFTNVAGALADPTTVTCKVRKPDGTTVTLSATKQSTGVYTATFPVAMSGTHWYRFEGTGAVVAAGEEMLKVRPQRVT